MRLKYYLRGLGLGILVSTLFLMLSIQLHGGIMTDERVIARAKELGMVIPDDGETDTPPLESESTQPDDAAQDDTAQDNEQPDDATSDDAVQNDGAQDGITPENAAQGDEAQDDTTSEDAAQGDAAQNGVAQDDAQGDAQGDIIFTVADGEVCRTAAEKLLACGLIEDVDAFRKYMSAHDYDGLIREGTYRIPVGADADTIAKIITAQVPEAVVVEDTETTDSQ